MSKIKYVFLLLFSLLIFSTTFAAEYTVPRAAYSVYAEDLDLDGDKDIVVGHNYNSQTEWSGVSILENDGYGEFTLIDSIFLYGGQPHVKVKNLDLNEFPEIIARYYSSEEQNEYIAIINNFNFEDVSFFLLNTSEGVGKLDIGDIDNDNDIDIVVASNNGFFWGYLLNNGSGEFSLPIYYDLSFPPGGIACGNLNEDNRNDIVVGGQETQIHFSYESGFQCYMLGDYELRVGIADMDNDGDNDIVGLRQIFNIIGLTIYENLGENNFYEHEQTFYEIFTSSFVISDLNNDSFPDIVCPDVGPDGGIYILYNEGDYNLSEPQFIPLTSDEEFLQRSFCADLDNNGFHDIITIILHYQMALFPSKINILFNDGNGNFVENPQVSIDNYELVIMNYELSNYPNPFNPNTNISFQLSKKCKVSLSIYNIKGQLVSKLTDNETFQKGRHFIMWNGKNNQGKEVSTNVYLYTLWVGDKSISKKMLLVR